MLYSAPKKSGKSGFAGLFTITLLLIYCSSYPEAILAANDQEQAAGRVFAQIQKIIEC